MGSQNKSGYDSTLGYNNVIISGSSLDNDDPLSLFLLTERYLKIIRYLSPYTSYDVRTPMIDCMDCIEKIISCKHLLDDEFGWLQLALRNLASTIISFANKKELDYLIRRFNEWIDKGYKGCDDFFAFMALYNLDKNRLGLSEYECVKHILKCDKIPASHLYKLLHIPAMRDAFYAKAQEGNAGYTLQLARYLYEQEEYAEAFQLFKNRHDIETSKYLGLMYYYGKGVKQNYYLAKKYLETYLNDSVVETEVIYALGNIYAATVSIKKACEIYQTAFEYADDTKNIYLNKIRKEYVDIRCMSSLPDIIDMTIMIDSSNLRCEFSIELPPYCFASINWGDRLPGKQRIDRCHPMPEHRKVTFRHKYKHSGVYEINIEALCSRSIEAFEFSRYRHQLLSVDFERCRGLKKVSIVGQSIKSLDFSNNKYLTGVICRENSISTLDIGHSSQLIHLDCSYNPLVKLMLYKTSALSKICIQNTQLETIDIDEIITLNNGSFCNPMNYDNLVDADMPLEYYFRCTTWHKVKKYIKDYLTYYYWHNLSECKMAFDKLKNLSNNPNHTPYKEGCLMVHGEYVSDDSILCHEEFFIQEETWMICLATKVRDARCWEPWMERGLTPPEYFVGSCLVNMINNKSEMDSVKILRCIEK